MTVDLNQFINQLHLKSNDAGPKYYVNAKSNGLYFETGFSARVKTWFANRFGGTHSRDAVIQRINVAFANGKPEGLDTLTVRSALINLSSRMKLNSSSNPLSRIIQSLYPKQTSASRGAFGSENLVHHSGPRKRVRNGAKKMEKKSKHAARQGAQAKAIMPVVKGEELETIKQKLKEEFPNFIVDTVVAKYEAAETHEIDSNALRNACIVLLNQHNERIKQNLKKEFPGSIVDAAVDNCKAEETHVMDSSALRDACIVLLNQHNEEIKQTLKRNFPAFIVDMAVSNYEAGKDMETHEIDSNALQAACKDLEEVNQHKSVQNFRVCKEVLRDEFLNEVVRDQYQMELAGFKKLVDTLDAEIKDITPFQSLATILEERVLPTMESLQNTNSVQGRKDNLVKRLVALTQVLEPTFAEDILIKILQESCFISSTMANHLLGDEAARGVRAQISSKEGIALTKLQSNAYMKAIVNMIYEKHPWFFIQQAQNQGYGTSFEGLDLNTALRLLVSVSMKQSFNDVEKLCRSVIADELGVEYEDQQDDSSVAGLSDLNSETSLPDSSTSDLEEANATASDADKEATHTSTQMTAEEVALNQVIAHVAAGSYFFM